VPNAAPRRAPISRHADLSYVRSRRPLPKKRRKSGKIPLFLVLFLLFAGWMTWAVLARKMAPVANAGRTRFDVLIALGTPADSDGHPTARQLATVNEAVREYERGVAPRILFTGGAVRNRYVEAETMARAAEAQGIPSSAILIENQARDTMQNACFSARILRQHGWNAAEVITSPTHLPRAALVFGQLPIDWQVHAAEPLTPPGPIPSSAGEALETLKTMRFLVWARLTEQCNL